MGHTITINDPTSAISEIYIADNGSVIIYGEPYLWTKNIHTKAQISIKEPHMLTFTTQQRSPYLIKNRAMFAYALRILEERRLVSPSYLQQLKLSLK